MSSIVALPHFQCSRNISHTYWNTRNHSPYEHFYIIQAKYASYEEDGFLQTSLLPFNWRGKKTYKTSIWFMYILLCKITLFYIVLSISKDPTHTCLVLCLHYHSSTQKTFHIWSAAVNSKASYWHYMCMLCFPHIILSCYKCRRMRTFVLWSEMCLLHQVPIGEMLKSVIPNCPEKKSALVSLSPPQTPHWLLWVWTIASMVTTY